MKNLETSISASQAYRLLLADEIAVALAAGASVIATGPGGGNDILGLVAAELAEAGLRSLSLRPPLDAASFAAQFADGWRTATQGAATPAIQATERVAVLVHDAHAIPPGALRHLDRLAAAWPNMQLAFAGLPAAAATIRSAAYPTLAKRASMSIDIAGPRLCLVAAPAGGSSPSPHATVPSAPAVPLPAAPARKAAKPLRKRAGRGSVGIAAALGAACVSAGLLLVPAAVPTRYRAAGLDWWRARVLTAAAAASRSHPPQAPAQPPADPPRARPVAVLATAPLAPDPGVVSGTALGRVALASAELAATPAPASTSPTAAQLQPAMAEPSQPEPEPVVVALAEPRLPAPIAPPTPSSPPVPQPVLARPALPPDPAALAMADTMTRRGRTLLELGDVSAARLLLERAAAAGSGPAALAMGATFDPATFDRLGALGVRPDPAQAAQWYRLALTRGEPQARAMLDALPTGIATSKPGHPQ